LEGWITCTVREKPKQIDPLVTDGPVDFCRKIIDNKTFAGRLQYLNAGTRLKVYERRTAGILDSATHYVFITGFTVVSDSGRTLGKAWQTLLAVSAFRVIHMLLAGEGAIDRPK
jgi:hypothetical protein